MKTSPNRTKKLQQQEFFEASLDSIDKIWVDTIQEMGWSYYLENHFDDHFASWLANEASRHYYDKLDLSDETLVYTLIEKVEKKYKNCTNVD